MSHLELFRMDVAELPGSVLNRWQMSRRYR